MWLLGMLMCTKKLYQNLNQFRGTSNRYKSKLYPGSHKLEEKNTIMHSKQKMCYVQESLIKDRSIY